MRKSIFLFVCAALYLALAAQSKAEVDGLVKIGGHLEGPVLSDSVWGHAVVNGVKTRGSYSAGSYFGSHTFIMYVSKDINDTMSVNISPDFSNAGAGATPSLGKKLGEGLKDISAAPTVRFYEATFNMGLPDYGVQMRAGFMSLPFIQDYGKELFWHEEQNGGKFTLGNSWYDTGLEIYKPFEAAGVSLPLSLYIVNGNSSLNRDNNNGKSVMIHVEPEFAGVKTFASFGAGKWGDKLALSTGTVNGVVENQFKKGFFRWSYGAAYAYKRFKARGEVAGGKWQDNLFSGAAEESDKRTFGYYGKVFYSVVPEKLTAMVHYNLYKADAAAVSPANHIITETYKTTTLGLQYELAPAATFIIQYDIGKWKNDDVAGQEDSIKFNRALASVKVTF